MLWMTWSWSLNFEAHDTNIYSRRCKNEYLGFVHSWPKNVAINFVHCKRRRQRIVYIYSIHVYYIYKQYAAAGACSARNLSRHFWAAYGLCIYSFSNFLCIEIFMVLCHSKLLYDWLSNTLLLCYARK